MKYLKLAKMTLKKLNNFGKINLPDLYLTLNLI